jgi:hypothetical protein
VEEGGGSEERTFSFSCSELLEEDDSFSSPLTPPLVLSLPSLSSLVLVLELRLLAICRLLESSFEGRLSFEEDGIYKWEYEDEEDEEDEEEIN